MANVETFVIDYKSDFGTEYDQVSFKVERGLIERTGLSFTRRTERNASCSARRYFNYRKLIVQFNDGKSIEIPIIELDLVGTIISSVLGTASDEIACVSLRGERWKSIPPGILGGAYATTGIEGVDKPEKGTYGYLYQLEGGAGDNAIALTTSVELAPDAMLTAQTACLDLQLGSDVVGCSFASGLKPRRFIGQRANTTTEGVIRRQAIVSQATEDEIRDCGATIMSNFNCLGYRGTDIPNVLDFYSQN